MKKSVSPGVDVQKAVPCLLCLSQFLSSCLQKGFAAAVAKYQIQSREVFVPQTTSDQHR